MKSIRNKDIYEHVENILSKYNLDSKKSYLFEIDKEIDLFFNKNSLDEIFEDLRKSNSKLANELYFELTKMSLLSLEITFQKYEIGKNLSRRETFKLDEKILNFCHKSGNLEKGIESLLIKKINHLIFILIR